MIKTDISKGILAGTDKCIKCGICIPHCPTYELEKNECESPRGRVELMSALVQNKLPANEKMREHLHNCLSCRACEKACPSGVPFGDTMDKAREIIQADIPIFLNFITSISYITKLFKKLLPILLLIYQYSGLKKISSKIFPILLIIPEQKYIRQLRTHKNSTNKIQIFTGCISSSFDNRTIKSAINVLNKLNYQIINHKNQQCCGAIHLHSGFKDKYNLLKKINTNLFSKAKSPIVSIASGCGATIKDYLPVTDISEFVAKHNLDTLKFKAHAKTVAIHSSCTLINVLKSENHVFNILNKIPDIKLIQFSTKSFCCGAAGTNMVTNAKKANAHLEYLLEHGLNKLAKSNWPEIIVTSNIGCAMHMRRYFTQNKINIEIIHPIELIDRVLIS